MADEEQQIQRFIKDSLDAGNNYFKYIMYENWCLEKCEQPIEEGRFNAIIFTRFGFSWTKEKGFKIQ